MAKIEVYRDHSGEYRWRKKADNGEIVADSGEGYKTETGALGAAEREAKPDDLIIVTEEA